MNARPAISCVGVAITMIAVLDALDSRYAIAVTLAVCAVALAVIRQRC